MLLHCGHVVNSSKYHPIQNVLLLKNGWTSMKVIFNEQVLCEYKNDGNEMKIEMKSDNNYNINLFVNNDKIKTSRQLFRVILDVTTENDNTEFYNYVDDMIVDH